MARKADNNIYLRRTWGTIRWAIRTSGKMPAKEFLEKLSTNERIKLETLLERMAKSGRIYNKEKFNKLESKIYEFKSSTVRLLCFQVANSWILTHGFIKKRQKTPMKEIDRAKEIRKEHLAEKKGKLI